MILRDYQNNIVTELKNKINNNINNILCTTSMGGGKSVIISKITKDFAEQKKTITILINVSSIFEEIKKHLISFNINFKIIKSKEKKKIYINNNLTNEVFVYLIMEQSYNLKIRNLLNIKTNILIKDEMHIGYNEKRYLDIKNSLEPNIIIGFSGTPFDEQGYLLEGYKPENLITYGDSIELTQKGYLVPLKYYIPKWSENIDLNDIPLSKHDYSLIKLEKKINTNFYNKLVIESINKLNGLNKKILIYCTNIKHANTINELLKNSGFKSKSIHSKSSSSTKDQDIIDTFINTDINDINAINVLVSVGKLTTGTNIPNANLLVLLRPTKIKRLYYQILYRIARLHPNKKFAEVLDLSQCISTHGFGNNVLSFLTKPNKSKNNNSNDFLKYKAVKSLLENKNESDPMEINENILNLKIKELRINDINVKSLLLNQLINHFNNVIDIESVIDIAFELNKRYNNVNYNETDVLNMIKKYENINLIELNDLKQKLKNEIKNKIFFY